MSLGVLNIVDTVIDKIFPDKEEAEKRKAEMRREENKTFIEELSSSIKVILAEINSDSWLAKNWRPITMLSFVTIIVNNFIIYPYLSLFWGDAPKMEIPPDMWDLLKLGLSGYVVGRSIEKGVKAWKER
jgi:hypothetical protein